jgi:hypothetical protein
LHDVGVPMDARDRVLDWQDEMRRLEPRLLELPAAAREAIREVVAAFQLEDAASPAAPRLSRAA